MRNKMLLSYIFVVLLPIVLIGYFLVARTIDAVTEQTSQVTRLNGSQIWNNVANKLGTYLNLADNVIADRALIQQLETPYADAAEYLQTYSESLKYYAMKWNSFYLDQVRLAIYTTNRTIFSDGKLIETAGPAVVAERWYRDIVAADGASLIQNVGLNAAGEPVFTIGRVLNRFSPPDIRSVLVMEVPESQLYSFINNEQLYDAIYILNGAGEVMTSTDRGALGLPYASLPRLAGELVRDAATGGLAAKRDGTDAPLLIGADASAGPLSGWTVVYFVSPHVFLDNVWNIVRYSILICLGAALVAVLFIVFFANKMSGRLRLLVMNMRRIKSGMLNATIQDDSEDEIGQLTQNFREMINRINGLISEVYAANDRMNDIRIQKKTAELKALQSQINPHFLFNTMNSINMNLIRKGDYETSDIVQHFAELLRQSIEWSDDLIPLGRELELVENYLKVQAFRFGDRLSYAIEAAEPFKSRPIPKFTLQPVVENALQHGLENSRGPRQVRIRAVAGEHGTLCLVVEDDGQGIGEQRLREIRGWLSDEREGAGSRSIGLVNVHLRLKGQFGERCGLRIESAEGRGTCVTLTIPND